MSTTRSSSHPGRTLAEWTLPVHARRLPVPTYDRGTLSPGVVHIGLGRFHRGHQAVYFDALARRGHTGWGVVGVSLRRPAARDALRPQDHLFTVVERDADEDRARVIGSVIGCVCAPRDPEAALGALADPRTRLVTLTITADGYGVDRLTGRFDSDAAAVAAELADPCRPTSAYGYLVEALARRRAAGDGGFTVLSCDNLPDNGRVTRTAVLSFATLRDPGLAAWIEEHVSFPGSMVDRITPAATDADRTLVAQRFGVRDACPVVVEPFSQWVIEDAFVGERPPLEEAGACFVDDVSPHKLVKSRMLNGSHTALAYLALLAGHRTIDRAIADPVFARFVDELLRAEVAPLLSGVTAIDLDDYRRTLLRRFANPRIGDGLARLAARGSTKLPSYLVPSLQDAVRDGRRHTLLVLAVAGWIAHLRGADGAGRSLPVDDPQAETLQPLARRSGADPRPLLAQTGVFGDLGSDVRLVDEVAQALADIDRHGARATVAAYLRAELAEVA
jgi:fructuronate reductase/mannitol 2-dehydrogenase